MTCTEDATDIGMDFHDPDYEIDSTKRSITQNTIPIPNLAMAMRTGMSARDCATVANAAFIDYGVISQDDTINLITPSKLRYAVRKYDTNLQYVEKSQWHTVTSIYFDGKKDATLTHQEINGKFYVTTKLEEHYVIVKEVPAASAKVIGEESRDGFIRTRLNSRKLMPQRETKNDFKGHII